MRGLNFRNNCSVLSASSFAARKAYFVSAFKEGKFLAEPEKKGKPAANPITDPAAMEGLMGAMKGNVAMMVPQTLIMAWINAFFAGFVLRKEVLIESVESCAGTKTFCSQVAIPTDSSIQIDAPIRGWHKGSGRAMGFESVLVLPHFVRPSTSVQLHPG